MLKDMLIMAFIFIILIMTISGNPVLIKAKDWVVDAAIEAVEYEQDGGILSHREGE